MGILLKLLVFSVIAVVPVAGSYCTSRGSLGFTCASGCCGTFSNRYCCYWGGGQIAGAVIGLLIGIAGLITLCICCCIRRRGAAGTVYARNPQSNVTFVHTETQAMPHYVAQPPVNASYAQSFSAPNAPPSYNEVTGAAYSTTAPPYKY
ncbi:hypothetical protein ScPMuIL_009391 [Solemya velum]